MRILWSSNAVWATTGYGIQAKHLLPRFQVLGHEVAQFAWYGLQGGRVNRGGIEIYPRAYDDWGNDVIGGHVNDFGADLVVSLQDIWVLPYDYPERVGVPWCCWFPVDHTPVSARVLDRAKRANYPVTYSKFGLEEMRKAGLECGYIPHGVDLEIFKPLPKQECRERLKWPESPFVVAMVGANKGFPARKGFPEALMAFKVFHDEHPDSILYLHCLTDEARGGVDFKMLIDSIAGFPKDAIMFVDEYPYLVGLPDTYLADVYNGADVLLQCSYNEGFGLPLIEAQACGTPVLATDWTSMPELVFAGELIEPLQPFFTRVGGWAMVPSVDSIIDGLMWAYDMMGGEQARAWLSEKARQGAAAYGWDKVVAEYWKPFLDRVAEDLQQARPAAIEACMGQGHDWAPICSMKDGVASYPCRRKECSAEREVQPNELEQIVPDGMPLAVHGMALDIEDDEQGTVSKVICREIEQSYRLAEIPFQPGDVVLDIGAHVGIVSIYLKKAYPFLRVIAVEPVPENYERLLRNAEANSVELETVQCAITADGRDVTIRGNMCQNAGGMTLYAVPRPDDDSCTASSMTLRQLFEKFGLESVKLLKLDVEGAEYEILAGDEGLLDSVDWLIGEFHRSPILKKFGYVPQELLELCKRHIPRERLHITGGLMAR